MTSVTNKLVLGILCLACFLPATIIGYMNRPQTIRFVETPQATPAAGPAKVEMGNVLVLPEIVIDVTRRKFEPRKVGPEKVWVCRDRELL